MNFKLFLPATVNMSYQIAALKVAILKSTFAENDVLMINLLCKVTH